MWRQPYLPSSSFSSSFSPKNRDERKEKDKINQITAETKAVVLFTSNYGKALRVGQREGVYKKDKHAQNIDSSRESEVNSMLDPKE